jgi:hypothetical protein
VETAARGARGATAEIVMTVATVAATATAADSEFTLTKAPTFLKVSGFFYSETFSYICV